MIDQSMLQEFINEAGEHLDEMETDLLQLEVEPENREILNDIFREIHSIKGAAEYVGLEVTAELSHKLENLLELIRQNKKSVTNEIIDLLIEARDRLVLLNEDLERFKDERTQVGDVIVRIDKLSGEGDLENEKDGDSLESVLESDTDKPAARESKRETSPEISEAGMIQKEEVYEEEYDTELFEIFLQQLKENISFIHEQSPRLAQSESPSDILDEMVKKIEGLRSSANYMGYERLTVIYDEWIDRIKDVQEGLTLGEEVSYSFMDRFINGMITRFPQVREVIADSEKEEPLPEHHEDEPEQAMEETISEHDIQDDDAGMDFADAVEKELDLLDEESEEHPADVAAEVEELFVEPAETELPLKQEIKKKPPEKPPVPEEEEVLPETASDEVETWVDMDSEIESEIEPEPEKEPVSKSTEAEREPSPKTRPPEEREVPQVDLSELELLLDDGKLYEKLGSAFDSAMDGSFDFTAESERERMEDALFSPSEEISDIPAEGRQTDGISLPEDETSLEEAVDGLSGRFDEDVEEMISPTEDEEENFETYEFERVPDTEKVDVLIDETGEDAGVFLDADDGIEIPEEVLERRRKANFGERIVKQTLRVDARKIDSLMNQVGELVVSRAWFSQLFNEMREFQQYLKESTLLDKKEMKQVRGLTFRLSEATVNLGRVANELQEGIMKIRMLPISQLFSRYPRLVRDLTRDTDKKVRLEVRGEDTELDKMIIEEISDPLVHIIRNAVDHGIESVTERLARGKPEVGIITLEAYHESNHVIIEVKDDGKGINLESIKTKAMAKGFVTREELDQMTPKEITALIMKPGFSTMDQVTHTSGRGVGMDVVKKNVEKLNGTIEIDSRPGKQTQFRVKIPLTLAIIPALLIRVGNGLFTLPLANVEETIRISDEETTTIEGVEVIHLRNSTLPLVRLSEAFGIRSSAQNSKKAFVVVVSTGMRKVGLVVDSLIGQEEVVIKPLADYLQENSGFSGATILGDGSISLILDVYELVNLTIDRRLRRIAAFSQPMDREMSERNRKAEITEA